MTWRADGRPVPWPVALVRAIQRVVHEVTGPLWVRREKTLMRLLVVAAIVGAVYLGRRPSMSTLILVYGVIGAAFILHIRAAAIPWVFAAIALVPFRIGTGTGSFINLAMIGMALLAGLWVMRMLLSSHVALEPALANKPWIVLLAVTGFSILAGGALWNPLVVTKENFMIVQLAQWAIFVISALAFWVAANEIPDRTMLRRLALMVIAIALLVVLGRAIPGGGVLARWVTIDGPIFRLWAVSMAAGFAVFDTGMRRSGRLLMLAAAVAIIWYPFVDGRDWASGWLPSLVALGVVVGLRLWQESSRITGLAITVAGLGFAAYAIPQLTRADQWSLSTRIEAWKGLFELLDGRWLVGLGLASYWHYWRGVFGMMQFLDPATGYLHFTYDPKVNMHNNVMDLLGQAGLLGIAAAVWLFAAVVLMAFRTFQAEHRDFGGAYAGACVGGVAGMLFAMMLADWVFPFVYNIGFNGFASAMAGWFLLGGLVVLDRTRAVDPAPAGGDHYSGSEAEPELTSGSPSRPDTLSPSRLRIGRGI